MTTVLVVDDHAEFRAAAVALLAAGGFRVVGEAANGADAIAAARALAPDVVLLDVRLPDHDGFAVSRRIRGHVPSTRVVLCSARAAVDYGTRAEECGAIAFFTKGELSVPALVALLQGERDQTDRR
ncbi:response regulator [Virgisporangium aurantiacum]|uniref:Response regulator n=1 Tax=Virgisporangium aurantiacum TaxID=175570 RepID=A0A8J3ZKZ6_9ACTN|nr:response regulator [Virgisporangium aurantiacum]GIJ63365.1 response regulator [Virgisporangium aurantiacum]